MNKIDGITFTKDEAKKLDKLADSIYNTVVVLDYFCSNQREIEELYNLTPVVKSLRTFADQLNCIFIELDVENL